MKLRALGRTGLQISEIVFGAGAVGGILINDDDETRRAALRVAMDGGINWIDTAPGYGNGKSEEALGWLLKEIAEGRRPHVSTKVRIDGTAGDYGGQVERGVTESLRRLQMESVDLFQVHNGVASSADAPPGALTVADLIGNSGLADSMESLRAQGLVRHIGFTATGEAASIHEVIQSGRFETAQVYYNLLNPSAGRDVPSRWSAYDYRNLINAAEEHGVGVLVIRALAAGVIATDERHGREGGIGLNPSSVAEDEERMRMVLPLLREEHGARSQVAVRYALGHPGVSGVLVGIGAIEHLELAIAASDMGPLPAELLSELDSLVRTDYGRTPA